MNNVGGYLVSNFIGAAISGAIGAGVSQDSNHPMLKGAIVSGLISTAFGVVTSAIFLAGAEAQKQVGVSGLHNPRFP